MRGFVAALLTGAVLSLTVSSVQALDETGGYPNRPIRLIVPFAAGSSSDVISRIVAAEMGQRLGAQVVVDNRVGGSTIVGTDLVAKSRPDGYTIGLANTSTHAAALALSETLPFDPIKDFTPVAMIGSSPFMLLGSKSVPAANMAELIDYARKNPGRLNYASAGPATLSHLAGELFKKLTGTQITHVPYRGTSQSVVDLLEGRIQLVVGVINSTHEFVRQGRLNAYAVLSESRVAVLPDVPTAAEAGVPGCEAALWSAIVLPAGAPQSIVEKLNHAVNEAVATPEVQESLRKQGIEPELGSQKDVATRIAADIAKWRDVIEFAQIGKH